MAAGVGSEVGSEGRGVVLGRRISVGPYLVAFLLGVLLAALLIPNHNSGSGVVVGATGAGAGGSLGAGSAGTAGSAGGGGALGAAGGSSAGGSLSLASGGSGAAGGAAPAAGAAGSATSPGTATAASGTTSGGTSSSAGGNSGASAPGVTAKSITIAVLGGDSSDLAAICPRCGQGGQATDKALLSGMIAAWHKNGQLPVGGRDLVPVYGEGQDLAAETFQSACESLVQDKPFVAITPAGGSDAAANCFGGQFHIPVFDASIALTSSDLNADYPYAFEIGPDTIKALRNWADWMNANGELKGQVIGLYTPADSAQSGPFQEELTAGFRAELKKLGAKVPVDYVYQGQGQSDDAVAVARMRQAGVTVVAAVTAFTEPSGFQGAAANIGWHPKYSVADIGYSMTDAVADVSYNAKEENGNIGMGTRWWSWSARHPATPAGNPAAAFCLQAYENASHTTLDVYNDDAKIRYLLDECSDLDVIMQALHSVGGNLTTSGFIHAAEAIQNLQVPEYQNISFSAQKRTGSNDMATAKFNAARWQPENDYWRVVGPWTPWIS